MDDVRKKVLLDIFASPLTLFPVAGGMTSLLYSWAVGGSLPANLVGVAAILGGVGMLATRLIVGLESITERAYKYLQDKQRRLQEESLDALDERLTTDDDPRPEANLRQLRQLYTNFHDGLRQRKISSANQVLVETVERLFGACVAQIERSHELWEQTKGLKGEARKRLRDEREKVVGDVAQTIEHLGLTVERYQALATERNHSELARLREELDESIRVARRTEERIAGLDATQVHDEREFQ